MLRRGPRLDGAAVVITGASSGIGRATAHRFAEAGARLVLAARSAEDLEQASAECTDLGADTLVMPADVGSEDQVEAVALAAENRFGRIDAWINNAGVIAYGHFEDLPSEVFDAVIRTNLLGQVYGARAALARFREQGYGVLVNVSSVWGRVTSPYVIPYVISKHGIRAFSECLREGLIAGGDAEHIHVCTVLPESVDTPIFQHAANYMEREAKPPSPIIDADRTARAIVGVVRRPRGERSVGNAGHALAVASGVMPGPVYERIAPRLFRQTALDGAHDGGKTGNVFSPQPELNRVEGGWRRPTGARLRRAAGVLGASIAAAGLVGHLARHKG